MSNPMGLRPAVAALAASSSRVSFRLAGRLHEVFVSGIYKTWGHESFGDYAAKDLPGYKPEYLQGLVRMVKNLGRLGLLGESDRTALETLGIGKLRVLSRAPDAVAARALLGEASDATIGELERYLRKARGGSDSDGWVRLTVALTNEQYDVVVRAMRIVGEMAGTLSPGRQLELMAAEALATWKKFEKLEEKRQIA